MSPKNKGKFGKGKSEVEATDEFVETVASLSERLKPHAIKIALLIGAFLTAVAGWGGYQWYAQRRDQRAGAALIRALDISRAEIVAASPDTPPDGNPNAKLTYPSREARSQATLAALDALAKDHSGTGAARESVLLRGRTLAELGRYDEAITAFGSFAKSAATNDLRRLAYLGMGHAFEAKGQATDDAAARKTSFEQALEAFGRIASLKGDTSEVESAYHEARLLAMLDRRDEALAKLRHALEIGRQSYLAVDIEERIALLEATAAK